MFTPPSDLSAPGADAGQPQVAFDPAGGALVEWERYDGSKNIAQSRYRPAGGAFGAAVNLSAPGRWATAPQFAFAGSGSAVSVWESDTSTNIVIESSFGPVGGPTSPPVALSGPVQSTDPQVATDGAGNAFAVWGQVNSANQFVIQGAYRPAGGAFAPAITLSASGASLPRVAFDQSGNGLVVWHRYNGSNSVVESRSLPAGSLTLTPAVTLSSAGYDALDAHVAFDATGNAVAVWTQRAPNGNTRVVAAVRPPGGAFGPPATLSADGQDSIYPQVAVDGVGDALVVWERNDGTNYIVQGAFRPMGGVFAPAADLSARGQDAVHPLVKLDGSGNALAVWQRLNAGGTVKVVQGDYRPVGGAFAAPVDLSDGAGYATDPQLAFDPSGTALVVWTETAGANTVVRGSFGAVPPALPAGGGGSGGGTPGGGAPGGTPGGGPSGGGSTVTSNDFGIAGSSVGADGSITVDLGSPGSGQYFGVATSTAPAAKASPAAKKKRKRATALAYGTGAASATAAGPVKLVIRPSRAAKRALKRSKRLSVLVTVTYRPAVAPARTKTLRVSVTAPKAKKKGHTKKR